MIVIVGAGPIGIEMAVALHLNRVPYTLLEAGSIGSTIAWYAPDTVIFSSPERLAIASVPFQTQGTKATREEYLTYLTGVVRQFHLHLRLNTEVTNVTGTKENFRVHFAKSAAGIGDPTRDKIYEREEILNARAVILALGNMHIPVFLEVKGEELPHVSHYLAEPQLYSCMKVCIVGSGNSAAEAAVRLYHAGASVTLLQRGKGFRDRKIKPWILPELEGLIREKKVGLRFVSKITAITPAIVEYVSESAESETLAADRVLLLTGYRQDTSLFERLGLSFNEAKRPRLDRTTMESEIKGVYVIGTASVGSETRGVTTFIENSHIHVHRVLQSLGLPSPFELPEAERSEEFREL